MFSNISMRELEQWVEQEKDIQIIDLRNRPSYSYCHFKNALNIPYSDLEQRVSELPKEKTLVFYCSRGGQSMLACNYLEKMGYQVVNVVGGICIYQGKYMVRQ